MIEQDTLIQHRYRIKALLQKGSIGAIYLAEDEEEHRKVVLKYQPFIHTDIDHAFADEARVVQSLHHPLFPAILAYVTTDDGHGVVMEYVEGEELAERITKEYRPYPIEDVLIWADQVLEGLNFLHTQTPPVIHRDIKPQNLKRTPDGSIKLVDFGFAKGILPFGEVEGAGVFCYTPDYAAPEQIEGKGTDARSDLYALAATLHHLLTASLPADALSRITDLQEQKPDPQRPTHALNRIIPSAVSDVLMSAMALDIEARPATAADMRVALQEAGAKVFNDDSKPSESAILLSSDCGPIQPTSTLDSAEAEKEETTEPFDQRPTTGSRWWIWAAVIGVVVVVGAILLLVLGAQ